jgi:hypothetical protein
VNVLLAGLDRTEGWRHPGGVDTGLLGTFSASRRAGAIGAVQFTYAGAPGLPRGLDEADMSWDVYLDFATDRRALNDQPAAWGAYTCGRTLYWRVWDQDRRVSSAIQTAPTFACSGTFSSP